MDIRDWLTYTLFEFGTYTLTIGNLVALLFALLVLFLLQRLLRRRILPAYLQKEGIERKERRQIFRMANFIIVFTGLLGVVWTLNLDLDLLEYLLQGEDESPEEEKRYSLRISTILLAGLVLQIARLVDLIVTKVLSDYYQQRNKGEGKELVNYEQDTRPERTTQYVVYVIAILIILQNFGFNRQLFEIKSEPFYISNFFFAILILLCARLGSWILTQIVLYSYYKRNEINRGSQFAINQLLKYLLYVIASLMALEMVGVKLTVVWGSAAALLVGVGLGLQQTFNDLISGIIILFERSVEVGDVVEIDGLIGRVKKIGIRTSLIETRRHISVIVPNSKLITDNVINWSHNDNTARFQVAVGVAYGSDTFLVKRLLIEAAKQNKYVLKYPPPFVRFVNFGSSSLDFELHFFTQEFMRTEDVKSELRFEIDRIFRENGVTIPFPQQDVWFKNTIPKEEENPPVDP